MSLGSGLNPSKPYMFTFVSTLDKTLLDYVEKYEAVNLSPENSLPLKLNNKTDLVSQQDRLRNSLEHDPNAIAHFLLILHGSYISKPEIIQLFVNKYPNSSKNLANKKL